MNKEKYKSPIPLMEAVEQINDNHNTVYIWFVVVNSVGCIFEIHGTSIDIEASIPDYNENGEVIFNKYDQSLSNLFIKEYEVSIPSKRYPLKKVMTREKLIDYLDKTDFRTNPITFEQKIIMVEKKITIVKLG